MYFLITIFQFPHLSLSISGNHTYIFHEFGGVSLFCFDLFLRFHMWDHIVLVFLCLTYFFQLNASNSSHVETKQEPVGVSGPEEPFYSVSKTSLTSKGRFKQLLIQKGKECRVKWEIAKEQ